VTTHAPVVIQIPELLPGASRTIVQVVKGVPQTMQQGIDLTYIGTVKHNNFQIQKTAGKERITSVIFPLGWVFWIVLLAAVVVLFFSGTP